MTLRFGHVAHEVAGLLGVAQRARSACATMPHTCTVVVHHRKAPHLVRLHHLDGVADLRIGWQATRPAASCNWRPWRARTSSPLRDQAHDDVAVGHDADEAATVG